MWSLKQKIDNEDKPWVIRENVLPMREMGANGYHLQVMWQNTPAFSVRLWSHRSCALSEIYRLNPYIFAQTGAPTPESLIEWLKTQPFKDIDAYEHQIFTVFPGFLQEYVTSFKDFLDKYTTTIATFPNYAHDHHLLNLRLLDLTKCT